MSDKTFADGFLFKKKQDNAPEWVIGKMSIKVDEAVEFLQSHAKNGWVNLEVKEAQSGKPYIELDTWEPKKENKPTSPPQNASADGEEDDVPF
jgi:hypothetical protein